MFDALLLIKLHFMLHYLTMAVGRVTATKDFYLIPLIRNGIDSHIHSNTAAIESCTLIPS